jgi:hypothetical protein
MVARRSGLDHAKLFDRIAAWHRSVGTMKIAGGSPDPQDSSIAVAEERVNVVHLYVNNLAIIWHFVQAAA